MTIVGSFKVHIAKMGIAEKVELTRVSLPAIDNHELMALILLSNLVMIGRYSLIFGLVRPIGKPR
jgi:hypothetical protein